MTEANCYIQFNPPQGGSINEATLKASTLARDTFLPVKFTMRGKDYTITPKLEMKYEDQQEQPND